MCDEAEDDGLGGLPPDPFWIVTIKWHAEGGSPELDDGGCSLYEVAGLLTAALDEVRSRMPDMRFAHDERDEDDDRPLD